MTNSPPRIALIASASFRDSTPNEHPPGACQRFLLGHSRSTTASPSASESSRDGMQSRSWKTSRLQHVFHARHGVAPRGQAQRKVTILIHVLCVSMINGPPAAVRPTGGPHGPIEETVAVAGYRPYRLVPPAPRRRAPDQAPPDWPGPHAALSVDSSSARSSDDPVEGRRGSPRTILAPAVASISRRTCAIAPRT